MASSSHPAPRDKLPTVVHSLGEETAAGPQDKTVTKGDVIPAKLEHYQVLHKLGQGGMGWVLLAEDTQLNRKVALKVMRGRLAADKESRERFMREAKAAAQLRHDNIITIYHVGEERNVPFIAMELLEGGTLQQRLEYPKPLSIGAAVRIAREIAQGLQAAHERGVIHRDIKPANIWLESPKGRVKLLDFGLARQADVKSGLTQAGEIVGTPHYMAPEQARAKSIDPRTDLFSLGCILYRMLTGKLPFAGESLLATLTSIAVDTPTPVIELNPLVSHGLADVVERLLSKEPAARPASAAELIEELLVIERDLLPSNRSGFSIEIPPAILRQTRLPTAASAPVPAVTLPPLVLPPSGTPPLAGPPVVVSALPRRPLSKGSSRAAILLSQGRWPWIVVIGLLAIIGSMLVLTLFWLASSMWTDSSVSTAIPPRAAAIDLRRTEALRASVTASKVVAEWALAKGGPAASVELRLSGNEGPRTILSADKLPDEPYSLVGIEFRQGATFADGDLPRLADIATLTWLDLRDTLIGDEGIRQIESLVSLTTLYLEGTPISNRGLAHVADCCPLLKRLHIGQTSCSDGAIESLTRLKHLEELSLVGLPLGDAELKHLHQLSGLHVLDLSGTRITNAGLGEVVAAGRLTSLALNQTSIGDDGLARLKSCPGLQLLYLNNCQLTNAGLAHLSMLPQLEWLEIRDNQKLSDRGLAKLAKIRSLGRLVVTNGQFSLSAREELQQHLEKCDIKLVDSSGSQSQ